MPAPVTSATYISITMGQALAGAVALVATVIGSVFTVTTLAVGSIKDDVGLIRTSVQAFQTADKDGILRLRDSETRLAEQIAGLRTDLVGLRGDLGLTNKTISGLGSQLSDFQKQGFLRQTSFSDPKVMEALIDGLKKAGIDGKVVIVPIEPSVIRPR
jgi:hypothetical protein